MEFIARWLLLGFWVVCMPVAALGQKGEKGAKAEKLEKKKSAPVVTIPPVATLPTVPAGEEPVDIDQVREELGVNQFTAPSIEQVLAELMDLRPIPIEKVWSDLPVGTPQIVPGWHSHPAG